MEKTYFLRSSVRLMSTKKVGSHSDSEKNRTKQDMITLEHLFVFCEHSRAFWKEISSWLHECGIETLPDLTDQINIMFGLFDVDNHFMLLNHIMLIAKQTIFLCRQKSITPSFIIFLVHLKKIFRIEELFIYWPYTILFTLYCCNFFFLM